MPKMSQILADRDRPFRFLLYLEWGLLSLILLSEPSIPAPLAEELPRFPVLVIVLLVIFGALGLKLPRNTAIAKFTYTGLQLALLVAIAALGSSSRILPFLHLIFTIRSCFLFQLSGRLTVTALSGILLFATSVSRLQGVSLPPEIDAHLNWLLPSFILLYLLSCTFILLTIDALLAERESREKLAIAHRQLQEYARLVEDRAALQERNRIARDIHDSLGHVLTALNLQLEGAIKLWDRQPDRARDFLQQGKMLGTKALSEVRESVAALRTDPLQGKSLQAALDELLSQFQFAYAIGIAARIELPDSLPKETETSIYRIIQEALTNIAKHAAAETASINLQAIASTIDLNIRDDGRGFHYQPDSPGFGLKSIRERTQAIGGTLEIDSKPGCGCEIRASFPNPNRHNSQQHGENNPDSR